MAGRKTGRRKSGARRISPMESKNFETLKLAFENEDVCLLASRHKRTGKDHVLICAVARDENGLYVFTPFARLLDGNPYADYAGVDV